MTAPSQKKMMLFSGRAFPELGREIADFLGIEPTPTTLFDFANGEIFVRFLDSVRGCDVFALQSRPRGLGHLHLLITSTFGSI